MKGKVCGITNEEDACAAAEAGASALGFIFAKESVRYIEPEAARAIIRNVPPFVTPVGVFVNSDRTLILDIIQRSGIRCLQLHGDELPADAAGFPVPVIKAFRVRNHKGFAPAILGQYDAQAYLLDTFVDGQYGGTGATFDWQIAVDAKKYGRIILSGGLTPDNVLDAINTVSPYAVDVNSGVESSPGKKDKVKLDRFFAAIKNT